MQNAEGRKTEMEKEQLVEETRIVEGAHKIEDGGGLDRLPGSKKAREN